MSKLTDSFRDIQIYNAFGFYTRGQVYISYASSSSGRLSRAARWIVNRTGYETDPDAHFMDYAPKTFTVWGRGDKSLKELRVAKLEEAKRWTEKKYGPVAEWKKDPYGSWGEATYVKARIKDLKAQVAALPFRTGDRVRVHNEGDIRTIRQYNGDGKIMLEGGRQGISAPSYAPSELTKVQ